MQGQYETTKSNIENAAVETVTDIWACIDWDKVDGRRAYGIWDEFTNKVKASARTTNSYETFVEKLSRKMSISSIRYAGINSISEQSEEFKQEVLKLLREQTQIIVLKLRLNNEARKDQNAKLKEEGSND